MWDVRACRSCLATDGKLEKLGPALTRIFITITGLTFEEGDDFPSYFCVECQNQIKRTLAFRRKTRRAEFVMKELLIVKKQITLSNILQVDRKRTNLESSTNFWDPLKSSYYTLHEVTSDEKMEYYDSIKFSQFKTDSSALEAFTPNVISKTCLVVDIKSDSVQEFEDDNNVAGELVNTNESYSNDHDYIDELEPETNVETPPVDMDDVFKDLKEPDTEESEDEVIDEPQAVLPKTLPKKEKTVAIRKQNAVDPESIDNVDIANYSLKYGGKAFSNFDIQPLDLEEQLTNFELRKHKEPFKSSVFKCAVCILIFKDLQSLMKHVTGHNETGGKYVCIVCKRNLSSKEDLRKHQMRQHAYLYRCNICDLTFDVLYSAITHAEQKHNTNNELYHESISEIQHLFECVTLSQEDMPLTESMLRKKPMYIKCDECQSTFMKQISLDNHIAKYHAMPSKLQGKYKNEEYAQCDICKLWRWKCNIVKHIDHYHRFRYDCKYCNTQCWNRQQAFAHKKDHMKTFKVINIIQYSYLVKRYGNNFTLLNYGPERPITDSESEFKILPTKRSSVLVYRGRYYRVYKRSTYGSTSYQCGGQLPGHQRCRGSIAILDGKISYKTCHAKECEPDETKCLLYEMLFRKDFQGPALVGLRGPGVELTDSKPEHCDQCGKSYGRKDLLYAHQMYAHGYLSLMSDEVEDNATYCQHCKAQFQNLSAFYTHCIRKNHPEADSIELKCTGCRLGFEVEASAREHRKRCFWQRRQPVRACPHCNEKFRSNRQLYEHNKMQHKDFPIAEKKSSAVKMVLCEECGKSVASNLIGKHRLKARGHAGAAERASFPCGRCGARLVSPTHLAVHVLYSHTPRPYICAVCSCRFKDRNSCRDHILKHHSPERPFTCEVCLLSFSHHDFLRSHAKKEHQIDIQTKKGNKKAKKVYVYPHMTIDASQIPSEILSAVDIELTDYMDNDVETVADYRNFLVVDPPPAANERPIRRKRPSKEIVPPTSPKQPKLNLELEEMGREIERELEKEDMLAAEQLVQEESDFKDEEVETKVECYGAEEIYDEANSQEFEIEIKDGERFVTIDGITYKIEEND